MGAASVSDRFNPESPVRTAAVLPVAVPYREPLFRALAQREDLHFRAIFLTETQPSWDVPQEHFQTDHDYRAQHLGSFQIPRPGRTPLILPRALQTALAHADPEVVVVSEYGPAALLAQFWARVNGRAVVILTECTPEIDTMIPPAQLALHRRLARRADGVIAVSSQARRRLLGLGVPEERITVALQSADLAAIREARPADRTERPAHGTARPSDRTARGGGTVDDAGRAARPDEDRLRVLTVARLVPDKNIALLLRAISQTRVPVVVDVVGEGFLDRQLQETAAELGLEVNFHGHLDGERLAARYAEADVFALLSTYEPFGVVVREAAAAGLPLLLSDRVGAVGDVAFGDRNALLVDPEDLSAATVALQRLLSDADLRARLGAASLEIDAETDGQNVSAFAAAVLRAAAARRRRAGA